MRRLLPFEFPQGVRLAKRAGKVLVPGRDFDRVQLVEHLHLGERLLHFAVPAAEAVGRGRERGQPVEQGERVLHAFSSASVMYWRAAIDCPNTPYPRSR